MRGHGSRELPRLQRWHNRHLCRYRIGVNHGPAVERGVFDPPNFRVVQVYDSSASLQPTLSTLLSEGGGAKVLSVSWPR